MVHWKDERQTRDELIAHGYVSAGFEGELEYMVSWVVDDKDTIRYHMLRNGKSVWEFPKMVNVNEINMMVKARDILDRNQNL